MQFFLLNSDYEVKAQYSMGSLMQYSDGVEIIFCGIDEATEEMPTDQVAQLVGTPSGASESVGTIDLVWGSFVFRGTTFYGWKTEKGLPARFTQVSGALVLNLVISKSDEVIFSTKFSVNVNPSATPTTWLDNINYAEWEELVSYFLDSKSSSDGYAVLWKDNTFTGTNTFTKEIYGVEPTSDNALATKSYTDDKVETYVASYVDGQGFAKTGNDNDFTTSGNTFYSMITIKDNSDNSLRVNVDGHFDIYKSSAHKGSIYLPNGASDEYYLGYTLSNAEEDKCLDNYAKKSEIPDVSDFAKKSEIPDVSAFITASTDNTFTGSNSFSKPIKADEIDNTNGNAMVRYKSSESTTPIVFGSSEKPNVLMGSGDRPTYSKDGADFAGEEIALLTDIPDMSEYAKTSDLPDTSAFAKLTATNAFTAVNTFSSGIKTNAINSTGGNALVSWVSSYVYLGNTSQQTYLQTATNFYVKPATNGYGGLYAPLSSGTYVNLIRHVSGTCYVGNTSETTIITGSTTRPYYKNNFTQLALYSDLPSYYLEQVVDKNDFYSAGSTEAYGYNGVISSDYDAFAVAWVIESAQNGWVKFYINSAEIAIASGDSSSWGQSCLSISTMIPKGATFKAGTWKTQGGRLRIYLIKH